MKFKDQIMLVTGAGRGIGAAIARAFAAEGGAVIVNYLQNSQAAQAVVEECKQLGGDAWAVQADVTSREQTLRMVQSALAEFGKIDVLINNAFAAYSFNPELRSYFWDLNWADYQRQMDGSLGATFYMCQAVLPHFKARSRGCIINLASDLVEHPSLAYHDYTTAKAALIGFSRNLAMELGPLGIRVNCVAPGLVYPTQASANTPEELKNQIAAQTPLRRMAQPQDIAGPVLFLASDWSQFMTGQTLMVDGGLVMR
jgi:3-oxoacyl-[acyl-carrier protein] reductase